MRGSNIVDITIAVGRRLARFVGLNCHFIFMLFMEGNSVSAVEVEIQMRLGKGHMPRNVGSL